MPISQSSSDRALLERIVQHDEHAMASLYSRYAGSVFSLCRRILLDDHEAADAVFEVFDAIHEQPHTVEFQNDYMLNCLMLRARHVAMTRRRQLERQQQTQPTGSNGKANGTVKQHDREPILSHTDGSYNGQTDTWLSAQQARACEALSPLTDVQRTVLEKVFFDGMTLREIAQQLDISHEKIRTHLREAMNRYYESCRYDPEKMPSANGRSTCHSTSL